jgi:MGT family glycosyltransferase
VAVACADGLPWATSATTSASLTATMADIPKVKAWAEGLQRDVLRRAGVDDHTAATIDLWHSPHLVLVFSTAEFVGRAGVPDHYAFVGPALAERGLDVPFDWGWLDHDGPTVLVSLGTLNTHNGGRFFAAAAEALASMRARGIIAAPPDLVPSPPPNVLVTAPVPQLALMPRLDAVVTHGGHNTVCEALAQAVPLVVAPIRDDQPVIAEQVVRAGAGVRVIYRRVRADGLRAAIDAALHDPQLRAGAERVRRSFAAAGGARTAADRIEALPARAAITRHPSEV